MPREHISLDDVYASEACAGSTFRAVKMMAVHARYVNLVVGFFNKWSSGDKSKTNGITGELERIEDFVTELSEVGFLTEEQRALYLGDRETGRDSDLESFVNDLVAYVNILVARDLAEWSSGQGEGGAGYRVRLKLKPTTVAMIRFKSAKLTAKDNETNGYAKFDRSGEEWTGDE
jgi:hypothetical protein